MASASAPTIKASGIPAQEYVAVPSERNIRSILENSDNHNRFYKAMVSSLRHFMARQLDAVIYSGIQRSINLLRRERGFNPEIIDKGLQCLVIPLSDPVAAGASGGITLTAAKTLEAIGQFVTLIIKEVQKNKKLNAQINELEQFLLAIKVVMFIWEDSKIAVDVKPVTLETDKIFDGLFKNPPFSNSFKDTAASLADKVASSLTLRHYFLVAHIAPSSIQDLVDFLITAIQRNISEASLSCAEARFVNAAFPKDGDRIFFNEGRYYRCLKLDDGNSLAIYRHFYESRYYSLALPNPVVNYYWPDYVDHRKGYCVPPSLIIFYSERSDGAKQSGSIPAEFTGDLLSIYQPYYIFHQATIRSVATSTASDGEEQKQIANTGLRELSLFRRKDYVKSDPLQDELLLVDISSDEDASDKEDVEKIEQRIKWLKESKYALETRASRCGDKINELRTRSIYCRLKPPNATQDPTTGDKSIGRKKA